MWLTAQMYDIHVYAFTPPPMKVETFSLENKEDPLNAVCVRAMGSGWFREQYTHNQISQQVCTAVPGLWLTHIPASVPRVFGIGSLVFHLLLKLNFP